MTKLLDIKKVYVCDLSEQARLNFISKFEGTDIEFVSCTDNKFACEDSDIIFDIEIGLLLAGKQTYTPDPKKRVYAQIVGMGCPDVAVAETARQRALKDKENVKVFDMQG